VVLQQPGRLPVALSSHRRAGRGTVVIARRRRGVDGEATRGGPQPRPSRGGPPGERRGPWRRSALSRGPRSEFVRKIGVAPARPPQAHMKEPEEFMLRAPHRVDRL